MRFIGVELDSVSGRIARALHPDADIRIESFRDTKLPEDRIDAVIGNPPFADVRLDYRGQKLPLHDFFIAKSLDALKPGGILALVTSHYTLDKQNAATREYLADRADFLGAIRLPSDAFKREGTAVVTDILFLRKRTSGQAPDHADPEWLETVGAWHRRRRCAGQPLFLNHPEMVLGDWSRKDTLYGTGGFSVPPNGDLAEQLAAAIRPAACPGQPCQPSPAKRLNPPPHSPRRRPSGTSPRAVSSSATTGLIHQVEGGQGMPVVYGGTHAQGRRHHDRQAARRPGRLARPRPPRAPVAERRLARAEPHRRPPKAESGL